MEHNDELSDCAAQKGLQMISSQSNQDEPVRSNDGLERYYHAGRIARAAMGENGTRKGFKTMVADDDPLAWWILTEIIADGVPEPAL